MKNLKKVTVVVFLLSLISAYGQGFTDISAGITGSQIGSIAWGDYDADGDMDLVVTGFDPGYVPFTEVYRNDGNDTFVKLDDLSIPGIWLSDILWFDFDNDADLDIFMIGLDDFGNNVTDIYENTGNDVFVATLMPFPKVDDGNVSLVDFNNDGYTDLTISGFDGTGYITELYLNDRNANFVLTDVVLPGVVTSVLEWADYDNDGDMDLLLAGSTMEPLICKLFENNGDGTFTETSDIFSGFFLGDLAWGDYNSDGHLDVLLSGFTDESERVTEVYKNNGDKTFTKLTTPNLIGVSHSTTEWADYDNDGDLDILIAGQYEDANGAWIKVTDIFDNNNDDTFLAAGIPFSHVAFWGESAFADYNNDGNIDLLISGQDDNFGCNSVIYRNEVELQNTAPLPPTTLTTSVTGNQVTMSWDEGSDSETPTLGLSYNLLLHKESGEIVFNSNSNTTTGSRLIPSLGNAGSNLTWTIKDLEDGDYYWAVQCIDYNFISSSFTEVETFTIEGNGVNDYELQITNYELKQNYPNPFNPHTRINYELAITNYELAEIVVYNFAGQKVWSSPITAHSSQLKGSILFDGSKFNSGIYYYSLVVDGKKLDTKSMILIK